MIFLSDEMISSHLSLKINFRICGLFMKKMHKEESCEMYGIKIGSINFWKCWSSVSFLYFSFWFVCIGDFFMYFNAWKFHICLPKAWMIIFIVISILTYVVTSLCSLKPNLMKCKYLRRTNLASIFYKITTVGDIGITIQYNQYTNQSFLYLRKMMFVYTLVFTWAIILTYIRKYNNIVHI